jgi:hypothetical protein
MGISDTIFGISVKNKTWDLWGYSKNKYGFNGNPCNMFDLRFGDGICAMSSCGVSWYGVM